MRYNSYGDDFLIDKVQPDEISEELVSVGELVADDEWQIINDSEHYLQEDYSTPERGYKSGSERNRKKGEHEPEDTGMNVCLVCK